MDFSIIQENDLFNKLSSKMQNELIKMLFGGFMRDFSVFFDECSQSFINRIIVSLTYRSFVHNQLIQSANTTPDELYFICQGAVVVCEPTCYEEPVVVYRKGTVINIYQVLL